MLRNGPPNLDTLPNGDVVLKYLGRRFYADDLLPSGKKAQSLDGLDPALREVWLRQKRQRSSGPQYKLNAKVGIGVRVSPQTRTALQRKADSDGRTLSTVAAEVLEEWAESKGEPDAGERPA